MYMPNSTSNAYQMDMYVEQKVDKHRTNAGCHRGCGFAAFPQGGGIDRGGGKGDQTPEHTGKVASAKEKDLGGIVYITFAPQVQPDEPVALPAKQTHRPQGQNKTEVQLKPGGVADAVVILRAEKLGSKDTCAGGCSENADIKDGH